MPAIQDAPVAVLAAVTPDYFPTLGIALQRGRLLSELDRDGAPGVAVINSTMAQQVWPGEDPVGRRVRYGMGFKISATVIGVVHDIGGINQTDTPEPQMFIANAQIHSRGLTVFLRCAAGCGTLGDAVRGAVRKVDAGQPISELQTVDEIRAVMQAPSLIVAQVTGFFAALALFLAALGTYAVLAYSVAARRQEFGIRMALGAGTHDLLGMVVGQGLKLAVAGLALGLIGAFATTRLLGFMLYHVSPTDPATFIGIVAILLVVAMVACYVPARRATRIDPTQALRYE
jgi:putative ABC transport system permease protein